MEAGRELLGRYRLVRPLGSGGMGTTWSARDLLFEEEVALKVLEGGGLEDRPAALDAFVGEFATLAGLAHPHLSQVRDFGVLRDASPPRFFYAADLVEGSTLAAQARGRPFEAVRRPLLDALAALAFLHRLDLRHGDFKPDNVLVGAARGRGTLIDLGCSRPFGPPASDLVAGTPAYLAPEVRAGRPADARADLYGVGVSLRALLSIGAGESPEVADLAHRLTLPDPAQRPTDVHEVVEALGGRVEGGGAHLRLGSGLVGRRAELGRFEDVIGALCAAVPGDRVLSLHGPDGIGRTRLLREMKWIAQRRLDVFEGNAVAAGAVASMLRRAAGGDPLPAAAAADLAIAARERLVARGRPVLLVLDELERLEEHEARLLEAFARCIRPHDPIALLTAGASGLPADTPALADLGLGPLDAEAVRSWLGPDLSARQLDAVMRVSGGVPGELLAVAAGVAGGDLALGDLETIAVAGAVTGARAARLVHASQAEREVLAQLAVADGRLDREERAGLDPDAIDALVAGGWARVVPGGLELVRSADGPRIEAALGPAALAPLHRARAAALAARLVAAPLGGLPRARVAGALCHHLAAAGDLDAARETLRAHRELARAHAEPFRRGVNRIVGSDPPAPVLLLAAEVCAGAGDPGAGLRLVARALRTRVPASLAFELRCLAGACYDRLGDGARAVRALRRALSREGGDGPSRARALARLSLALVRRGAIAEAAEAAAEGLDLAADDATRVALHCNAALAAAYLGDLDGARVQAEAAGRLEGGLDDPRVRYRAVSARALVDLRGGDARAAADGYRRALGLAEEGRAGDLVVTACLNHGAAAHRLGDWGAALRAYDRGFATARALGMTSTEVTVCFDLARLHADIGNLDRAQTLGEECEESARLHGLPFLMACATSLRADLAAWTGRPEEAMRLLDAARETFEQEAAARELIEVALQRARVELASASADPIAAGRVARDLLGAGIREPDLASLLSLRVGEALRAAGEPAEAARHLERALEGARAVGERALEAEVEAALARAFDAAGSPLLACRHRDQACLLWEQVRTSLPAAMRDTFDRHPVRAGLAPPATTAATAATTDTEALRRVADLERLLSVYRRMGSATTVDEVLRETMDAAIDISEAERGFLIVAATPGEPDAGLRVPVARNVDRERVGRSHLKFSRGVAERVIRSGEPVITVDAASDDRFAENASVHAMRLKSILCVPIHSPSGVLGAIYLDNRFRAGGFRQAHVETMLAFADQVSLALGKARLYEELRARTEALEAERRQVEALLAEREARIASLSHALELRREAVERRFDYGSIVGTSPAMQRVFDVVDRVIDAEVTVLIRGESGTGKELIARAIHGQGPRREGPFVALNCGALPAQLLEAELFGYRKGAFTGATRDHPGLFAAARGGTLFLDELGEMAPEMQVKLLRVLQEREVRPLGGSESVPVDVRLVCATNRDLEREVATGGFREDLYYRVAVVTVALPPLRERLEDLPMLARALLERLARGLNREAPELDPEALRVLLASPWPGNVRQLENVLTRALLLARGPTLGARDLGLDLAVSHPDGRSRGPRPGEAGRLRSALDATGWNVSETARALGMSRATLYRRLVLYGLARPGRPSPD